LTEGLAWPPKREDLVRLYVVEKLSAAKIAQVYGLKYKNPKVAESTVLYQLKKKGIPRRDAAEHVRKVTEDMIDDWVVRYEAGESLKQIASGLVSPVTVWNHLKARGVTLRDKVEAQIKATTKYRREPFSGDAVERAYLMGLRYGDLHVVRHGRAVRVRVSTTHPAMAELFESLFSPYGHVSRCPRKAKLVDYEWTLECDLDGSFVFLLNKPSISVLEKLTNDEFLGLLAGIFDAEGSVYLHKKRKWYDPEVAIVNADGPLIDLLFSRLRRLGFDAHELWRNQKEDRSGIKSKSVMGRVVIWKFADVQRFLQVVHLRHREKTSKAELVGNLSYGSGQSAQVEMLGEWKDLKGRIRFEREEFLRDAATAISEIELNRHSVGVKESKVSSFLTK
jgi:hypothetical protein